ncbi:MAG: ABC transporter ATP-binding protein/permease [Clostridiales bacterium]|nr:ABC transporter ATP-binding protein/permease [Clostridiales bacterium]
MPPRFPREEHEKVPVIKNLVWATKILIKADKWYLISNILSQCASIIFGQFIQSVLLLKVLLSVIQGEGDFAYYVKCLVLFLVIGLVTEVITVWGDYMARIGEKNIFKSLNNMLFEKAAKVDVSSYEDPAFYDKYQRAANILTNGYFSTFSDNLATVIGSFISFVSVISVITSIDPSYLIFLLPVMLVFVVEIFRSKVFFKRDLKMTKNNRVKAYIQRTVFLRDFSKDMRTSNIFSVIMKRFYAAIKSNIEIIKKYGMKLFLFSILSSFCGEIFPIVGTYAYAGYQFAVSNNMDISGFSVVLSSINSVRGTTMSIARGFSDLTQVAFYFQNMRDFFEYESKITDGDREAGEFESLELKNVSFKYPSAKDYSLKDVNLKIEKGQTVAIVGINGAGKSTLVKLLLRFYDVTKGEILYNGINIKEYKQDSLRNRFATVFQDYKTFALSVNENVLCRECSEEDEEIARQALIKSGVWDKINTLENKGNTLLTREFDENGVGLSGGEAQKTAVARIFAKNFDIAILDEPSSALDPIAEYKMYENLIEATEDKTVIYISHRLSSAVLSQNIFVLENGMVIESGSHSELMQLKGKYSEMFTLQASAYKEEGDGDEE